MDSELIFLTGLSIDKKSLNNAYKNVSEDLAFHAYLEDIKDICSSTNLPSEIKKRVKGTTQDEASNAIAESITENASEIVKDAADLILPNAINSLLGLALRHYDEKTHNNAITKSPFHRIFLDTLASSETVHNQIKKLKPLDFFNVYLSNQSDIRAVPAIGKMVSQRQGLRTHWGFCDRPFYANQFIDTIELEIKNNDLNTNKVNNLLHDQYIIHGIDIVLSKIAVTFLEEGEFDPKISDNRIFAERAKNFSNEIGKSISERCFFGIDLLSRILVTLYSYKQTISNYRIATNRDTLPLIIKISEDIKGDFREYIIELIELASDPDYVRLEDNHGHKDDGDTYDLLIKQPENTMYATPTSGRIVKGSAIKYAFFKRNTNLLVPIKLFLSLPLILNEEKSPEKISQKHLLPELLITNKLNYAEVLTSGGIEHNRALMHLINAHRKERRQKRVFGFLDNHFDFFHRWSNDDQPGYDHLFIMGIAQPVSGFNQILIKRSDDSEGFSTSMEAKHIIFDVHCEETNKQITVLSSYGFSAKASVYATFRMVTRLLKAIQGRKSKLLKDTVDKIEGDYVDIESGYSWKVTFSEDTEQKMNQASNDVDPFSVVTSPNFPEESQKLVSIFSKNTKEGGVLQKIHKARITNHGQ